MSFDLTSITRGKEAKPPRIVLYGVHGIGKSSWANSAPNPIFIQTEDRLAHIDAAKFPLCKTVADVTACLTTLYTEDHPFETVVLDSLDWYEKLVHAKIREDHGSKIFTDYGKGHTFAIPYFEELLEGLDALKNDKNMAVICIAHANIKRFDSPETEPYDRYKLDLNDKVGSTCEEWADCVLFTNYKVYVQKTDVGFNKEQARGVGQGARTIYTEERPAFHAKNSYKLPKELPMPMVGGFDIFQQAMADGLAGKTVTEKPEVPAKNDKKKGTKAAPAKEEEQPAVTQ